MKIQITICIHAREREDWDDEAHQWMTTIEYSAFPFKMETADRIFVCEQNVTVEIPDDFDIRKGAIAALNEEKVKIAAEYQKRITEINAKIQSLLAIEA